MKAKSLFILPMVSLIVLSCSSSPNSLSSSTSQEETEKIIEVDRSYMETFDLCEGVSRWYESDEEMYEVMSKPEADAAFSAWNNLKFVCSGNRLYEAKDLLTSGEFQVKLLTYLRNSTAMYHYFLGIKYRVLRQVDYELAQKEVIRDLELCLAMTDAVRGLSKTDSVNVPVHYGQLFSDYMIFLVRNELYEKAQTLPDRLYDYCILDGMTENEADCRRCVLQAKFICMTSDTKTALKTINQIHTRMENDPELAESAESVREILMECML